MNFCINCLCLSNSNEQWTNLMNSLTYHNNFLSGQVSYLLSVINGANISTSNYNLQNDESQLCEQIIKTSDLLQQEKNNAILTHINVDCQTSGPTLEHFEKMLENMNSELINQKELWKSENADWITKTDDLKANIETISEALKLKEVECKKVQQINKKDQAVIQIYKSQISSLNKNLQECQKNETNLSKVIKTHKEKEIELQKKIDQLLKINTKHGNSCVILESKLSQEQYKNQSIHTEMTRLQSLNNELNTRKKMVLENARKFISEQYQESFEMLNASKIATENKNLDLMKQEVKLKQLCQKTLREHSQKEKSLHIQQKLIEDLLNVQLEQMETISSLESMRYVKAMNKTLELALQAEKGLKLIENIDPRLQKARNILDEVIRQLNEDPRQMFPLVNIPIDRTEQQLNSLLINSYCLNPVDPNSSSNNLVANQRLVVILSNANSDRLSSVAHCFDFNNLFEWFNFLMKRDRATKFHLPFGVDIDMQGAQTIYEHRIVGLIKSNTENIYTAKPISVETLLKYTRENLPYQE